MPEAAAAPIVEEVFGPELFAELLGGGGGGAGGGVAAIESAAPGTIAKGLTDAEVANSVFAPAAGAAGAAASAAGGGAPGAEAGGAAGAAPAGGFVGDLPLDAGAGAGGGGFVGDLPVDPSAGAAQTPINQLVPAASTSGAPGASGLPTGGADTAGFGPPVADTLPGSPEDPLRKAVDTATGSTTTAPASGAGVSAALQKLGIWGPEGLGKNALPLGVLGGSQVLAAQSRNTLAKQLKEAGAGANATSTRLLGQGASGDIPPSIMAQFDRSLASKREEIAQRYANMGRDAKTDSGAQFEMQRAQDARDAQVAQYASQLTSQGLQAASIAAGPTTNAALAAAQQDKDLAASMGNTLSTLAMLEAMNGRKASTP